MRGTRWLLLVAIAVILGSVGLTYRAQKKVTREQAPAKPPPLPTELNSSADHWHWTETDTHTGRKKAEIDAEDFKQVKDGSRIDLKNVSLKLTTKTGDAYDLIQSAAASFFPGDHRLYSEGQVQITLDVPFEGQPAHTLVSIQSSGVNFDSNTGRAETERDSRFVFEHGDGKAAGAFYDPSTHELQMKKDVELHWKPGGPNAKPMKIEAASGVYHEAAGEILLSPWGRLTRENTVVEGENAVVHLQDKVIQKVEASHAHGTDSYPNRTLQYSADRLLVNFDEDGQVRHITGDSNARLVSTSAGSETTVTASRVELDFTAGANNESLLTQVTANGQSQVVSKPLPAAGSQPGETHILRSESLEMKMRPGGREMESVVTHAPGTLEFVPNLPVQHHRTLEGNDLVIAYGAENHIESFHAKAAKTRTDPTEEERKRNRGVAVTSSRDLAARFEPRSSRMASMEQSGDFTYDEGDRKARAAHATLDSNQNVVVLDTAARLWDANGSTSANHIRMDQRTGDFTAEGAVNSSRLPDKDPKKNSDMLSGDELLQAQARKMDSSNHNRKIHYEGNAVLWQGANRIQSDAVDVDRDQRTLAADGNVVSNLWEQPKDDGKKKAGIPVLTVVHAPHLVYTDENRLAVYTGGVTLHRPGLDVKGRELRAFLGEAGADSRLDKAIADGAVVIVQNANGRTRTGTGEHGEYYTADEKVILRGGRPRMVDSQQGVTEGDELTYFANDGRLLVNAQPSHPVQSRIIRKRK